LNTLTRGKRKMKKEQNVKERVERGQIGAGKKGKINTDRAGKRTK
jgi:hypothetical protein